MERMKLTKCDPVKQARKTEFLNTDKSRKLDRLLNDKGDKLKCQLMN